MIVQHNMDAQFSARMGKENSGRIQELTSKLSSGYRLLHTKNDAAGSTISQEMRSQIRGLDQANQNGQDGIYLLDVADGAASQIHSMIQRIRELAVQAANDVYLDSDRQILDNESAKLIEEADRVATETEYNTMKIIDGSFSSVGNGLDLQLGANSEQNIEVLIKGLKASNIGLDQIDLSSRDSASSSITQSDESIAMVSSIRGELGAVRSRLSYAIHNTSNMSECLQSTESRIADTDMAETMVEYSKESILRNAISAMLSQSMKHTYGIASLLQQRDSSNRSMELKDSKQESQQNIA